MCFNVVGYRAQLQGSDREENIHIAPSKNDQSSALDCLRSSCSAIVSRGTTRDKSSFNLQYNSKQSPLHSEIVWHVPAIIHTRTFTAAAVTCLCFVSSSSLHRSCELLLFSEPWDDSSVLDLMDRSEPDRER